MSLRAYKYAAWRPGRLAGAKGTARSALSLGRVLFYRRLCTALALAMFVLVALWSHEAHPAWPPERIVSIAPSMTEMLFALGLGEKVVGVTDFCDYPPEARKKLKVGGMSNPSLEAVMKARPDVVMMTTDGNPKAFEHRLRSLGIRTYVFKAKRISELPGAALEMGRELGAAERGGELAGEIEAALGRLAKGGKRTGRALFVVWPDPLMVAGPGTAADDALSLLGFDNVASDAASTYPKFSIEEAIRREPEVIFIGSGHADLVKISKRLLDRLGTTPAVRGGRVYFVGDGLFRLGPRVISGIEELLDATSDAGGRR